MKYDTEIMFITLTMQKNQTNIRIRIINEPLTFTWWHIDQQDNDDLKNTIDKKAMNDNEYLVYSI